MTYQQETGVYSDKTNGWTVVDEKDDLTFQDYLMMLSIILILITVGFISLQMI